MNFDGSSYEEVTIFLNEPLSGQVPLGTIITASDGAFCGLTQVGGDANHGTLFRVATPEQIVGIAKRHSAFRCPASFHRLGRGTRQPARASAPLR